MLIVRWSKTPLKGGDSVYFSALIISSLMGIVAYVLIRDFVFAGHDPYRHQISAVAWMSTLINLGDQINYSWLRLRFFKLNLPIVFFGLIAFHMMRGHLKYVLTLAGPVLLAFVCILLIGAATDNTTPDRAAMILAPLMAMICVQLLSPIVPNPFAKHDPDKAGTGQF
jgi:hypothetical protein